VLFLLDDLTIGILTGFGFGNSFAKEGGILHQIKFRTSSENDRGLRYELMTSTSLLTGSLVPVQLQMLSAITIFSMKMAL